MMVSLVTETVENGPGGELEIRGGLLVLDQRVQLCQARLPAYLLFHPV